MGAGIAIGLPIGMTISFALNNFAFIGVGLAIGVAIGVAIEENAKKKGQIIPLTKKQKSQRKKLSWIMIILGIILFGIIIRSMIIN